MENTTQNLTPNVIQESNAAQNLNQEINSYWFIKKQTVKNKINSLGCMVGEDFYPKLNEFIESSIVKAIHRTRATKRKTVKGADI